MVTTRGTFSIKCIMCSDGDGDVVGKGEVEDDESAGRVGWRGLVREASSGIPPSYL